MKKLFLLIALTGMIATSCDDFFEEDYGDLTKIWYTTTDGEIAEPYLESGIAFGGADILSNNYSSGQGIIRFDGEVTHIGLCAFRNCGNLESIILPNSVKWIRESAFENCGNLESITIPNGLITIRSNAFSSCKSLKSITIPDGVTTIDNETFRGCSSLESVSLGNGLTNIGYSAFRGCSSLKSVTIPDNVTTVAESAFNTCKMLESVTLGNGIKMIEYCAFDNCSSLKSVYCKATTPPDFMGAYHFKGRASDCKFYVPTKSVSAYKNDVSWRQFADHIVGYDFE